MRLSALHTFASDPLLATPAMADDQRSHPVVAAILGRRDEGSLPGERSDGRRIALVIEGGGMRGVVSAGMAAAIEQLGLRDAFDEVHGASAGAFNATFLLARQASYLTALYQHGYGDPAFVSVRSAIHGGPLFDLDYVIGEVWRTQRPLCVERILSSGIELHCTATDVERAAIADLTDLRDDAEIRCALRASARLPWLAGPPVSFRGRRWLDATIAEAIPLHVALTTATDLLVLQTRPHGVGHTPLPSLVTRLTERYVKRINPALVELVRTRSERYDELSDRVAALASSSSQTPAVCVIRPPAGSLLIGQMENRRNMLAIAGSLGMRTAWNALTGEDPELLGVPIAHPRGKDAALTQQHVDGQQVRPDV
jgi:predicted patatin/cPLA2 family phospholipase